MGRPLKDLNLDELACQWHVAEIHIEKLEDKINKMYSASATKRDITSILKGHDLELNETLLDKLDTQHTCEYWLKHKGITKDQIREWNITPKTSFLKNIE